MCWFLKASHPPMFSPINYFNFIPYGQMVFLFLPYMVRHTRLFNLTSLLLLLILETILRSQIMSFRYSWNDTNVCKLFVLDRNTWNHSTVCKLFAWVRNTSSSLSSSCRAASMDIPDPLATFPYRSSPLAGLQGYIPYPHVASICMFLRVVLLLFGHMWGSIGVHHLWARLCFSISVLHVRLTWIVFVMVGRWPYSWCFVGSCLRDLFNIARSILV